MFFRRFLPIPAIVFSSLAAKSDGSGSLVTRPPATCLIGGNGWVVNHVNVDFTSKAVDYPRRNRTHDGHKRVDIAMRDRLDIDPAHDVVAAALGRPLFNPTATCHLGFADQKPLVKAMRLGRCNARILSASAPVFAAFTIQRSFAVSVE